MRKLKKANVDRSVVQKSIAATAQSVVNGIFAVLLKHTDRVDDAIVCAERNDTRLDQNIVRLYKRACEIKLDIRTTHSTQPQSVPALCDEINKRLTLLLGLNGVMTGETVLSMSDTYASHAPGMNLYDQQPSSQRGHRQSISTAHTRGASIDIDELQRQSHNEKRGSVLSKSRAMNAMMKSTVRAIRVLRSLMHIRTRAVQGSTDPTDSVSRLIFSFIRDKSLQQTLVSQINTAVSQQRWRAEHRLNGLQAMRQHVTSLLVTRSITTYEHDQATALSLAEMFVVSLSRSLMGSSHPSSSTSSSSSLLNNQSSTHILSNADSVGIAFKSELFNEYMAFINVFIQIIREDNNAINVIKESTLLHLIHLCVYMYG